MRNILPFSISGRSPPCFPLSDFQLNPPQQRWQLATDDGGLDVLGRTEQSTPEVTVDDDDDSAAIDLRAALPAVLAHISTTAVEEADTTEAQVDDDGAGNVAAATSKLVPSDAPHDPLTCVVCGPRGHIVERLVEGRDRVKRRRCNVSRTTVERRRQPGEAQWWVRMARSHCFR